MIAIEREMLWQWDYGQRVQLHDVPVGTAVHFSNAAIKPNALVTEAYEDGEGVYANIPNILLQTAGTLTAYIYLEDGDEGHTEYRKMFIVRDREKPDDYVYTEDEVKTWEALEERIKALEESGGGGAAGGLIRPLSEIGEIDGVTVKHVPDKDRVELTVEMTVDSMNSVFGGNAVYKNDYLNARQLQLMFRIPGAGRLFLWELFEDDLITVTNYPNKKFIMVSTNRMIASLTYDENGQFVSENTTYQANVQTVEEMIAEAVSGLPRSDWNQNDGTQKNFILGRTHYTESRDFTYSVYITLDNSGGWMRKNDPDFAKALYDNWENATFTKDGSQNRIRRDSIEYNKNFMGSTVDFYAALEYESGGNSIFLGINLTDGFVLIGEDSASWGSVHITFPVHEEIVHPLDEKYIPDSIARKSDIPQGGGSADIPDTLPNPHPLTFTGAVKATYDGSTPVEVEIPMGGAGETWDVLANFKAEEDVANFLQTTPPDGHSFDEYTEFIVLLYVKPNSAGKTTYIKLSINNSMGYGGFFRFATGGIKDTTKKGRIEILHVRKTDAGWIPVFGGRSYNEDSMNNGIQFMPNLGYDVLTLNKQPNADPEDISTVMQTDKVKLIAIGGYETVLGAGSMAIVYGKRGA